MLHLLTELPDKEVALRESFAAGSSRHCREPTSPESGVAHLGSAVDDPGYYHSSEHA